MKLALITQNNEYDFRKNTEKPYFKFEYLRSEKINQLNSKYLINKGLESLD
jgi:hypothetical protein